MATATEPQMLASLAARVDQLEQEVRNLQRSQDVLLEQTELDLTPSQEAELRRQIEESRTDPTPPIPAEEVFSRLLADDQ